MNSNSRRGSDQRLQRNNNNNNNSNRNQRNQRNGSRGYGGRESTAHKGFRVGLNVVAFTFEKMVPAAAVKYLYPVAVVLHREFAGYNDDQRAVYRDHAYISIGLPNGAQHPISDEIIDQMRRAAFRRAGIESETEYSVSVNSYGIFETVDDAIAAPDAPAYVVKRLVQNAAGKRFTEVAGVKLHGAEWTEAAMKPDFEIVFDGVNPVEDVVFLFPYAAPLEIQAARREERTSRAETHEVAE